VPDKPSLIREDVPEPESQPIITLDPMWPATPRRLSGQVSSLAKVANGDASTTAPRRHQYAACPLFSL